MKKEKKSLPTDAELEILQILWQHKGATVREVVDTFSAAFGGRPGWRRDGGEHPKEASALTLSSGLAHRALSWSPRLSIHESLTWTADWYRASPMTGLSWATG